MKIGLIKYTFFIGTLLLTVNANASLDVDSLQLALKSAKGYDRIKLLNDLSYAYKKSSRDDGINYNKLAYDEALLQQDTTWQIYLLIDLSYSYRHAADLPNALASVKRAQELARKVNDMERLKDCYNLTASIYLYLNIYDKAMDHYHKALKIYEKENDQIWIARTLNNIGIIFYKLDDNENALDYFTRSLNIRLSIGEESKTFMNYNNLALIYNAIDNYEQAIYHFKKAIEVGKKYDLDISFANAYNGLGNVYIKRENLALAREYIYRSIDEAKKIKDLSLLSSNYYFLAKIAIREGDLNQAHIYLHTSDSIGDVSVDKQRYANNILLHAEIFEAKEQYDSAFYFQKLSSDLLEEIFNERLAKNLAEIQLAMQAEKASEVIASKDRKLVKNRELNYFLLTIIVLSLALILLIYRNYKVTNRINQRLSDSYQEIEVKSSALEKKNVEIADAHRIIENQNVRLMGLNEELEDAVKERTMELRRSNDELEKAVHDLDQFIYKTSHDLRGPIATMQGLVNLGILESNDETAIGYFGTLKVISNNLNEILTHLIKVHETYQSKPHIERVKIKDIIYESLSKFKTGKLPSHIEVFTDFNGIEEWACDKSLLSLIIESMMTNASLYAKNKDAYISLGTRLVNGNLRVRIEDNGYGIQDNDLRKVFTMFFKGSPSPGGTGLEIYAAKVAAEKLGGNIVLEKPMSNTIFDVYLPERKN
ncbi:MAG: tetratricopeptide repeat protein [Cyclobacteriaceae bacterium]